MSYVYTACKRSLEYLFGLEKSNPSTGSHRQSSGGERNWARFRTKKRHQLPWNVLATRGLLVTDHVILNHGQVTWTTPELAPPSPNYHTTPTGGLANSWTALLLSNSGFNILANNEPPCRDADKMQSSAENRGVNPSRIEVLEERRTSAKLSTLTAL
ncbi:hypothetical protein TNCV_2249571 [Trichonephila clavipes]|nr:hypothetical protein TNCV_2249571 [Trichonephila clavipes]